MAVKIKLMRLGKIREPYYRIVVADARTRRDGRAIETIGKYHPKRDPSLIEVDSDRAQYWLGVGAQPTQPVRKLLEVTGDWQRFKGLPGAEGTLRQPAPPVDRQARFQAALAAAGDQPTGEASTAKRRPEREPRKQADSAGSDAEAGGSSPDAAEAGDPSPAGADAGSEPAATDASSTS